MDGDHSFLIGQSQTELKRFDRMFDPRSIVMQMKGRMAHEKPSEGPKRQNFHKGMGGKADGLVLSRFWGIYVK